MDRDEKKLTPVGMTVRSGAFAFTTRGSRKYDWRDPYHLALALSWPRFIAVLLGLDLAINFIFALLYLAVPGSVSNVHAGSPSDAFFFSLETLATVGYGVMAPATLYGHIISSIEIFSGMTFMAI